MKLSNKILIGFFVFIFIYLTAVFAEVRFRGTPNIMDDTNSIAETVDLPAVTFLVLQDLGEQVNVVGSDDPRLEVRSFSGDLLRELTYKLSGDTLTLSGMKSSGNNVVRITVFVPKAGLKKIAVDAARSAVEGLEQDHLQISQNAGSVWMSDSRIGTVHVEASQESHLQIFTSELQTLSVAIEGSEVSVFGPVTLLKGTMKDDSYLHLNDADDIQFRKDESSRLNLYQ